MNFMAPTNLDMLTSIARKHASLLIDEFSSDRNAEAAHIRPATALSLMLLC